MWNVAVTLGGDTSNRNQTVRKEPSRRQRWRVFWASLSLIRQRKIQVDVFRRKANIISKYRLSLVPRPLEIHLRRDMLPFSFVYLPVKFHSLCSFGGEMKVKNETCSFTSNPAREQPSKCRGWGLCWWSRGLRICLPAQGTRVWSLAGELPPYIPWENSPQLESPCATNYRTHTLWSLCVREHSQREACALQQRSLVPRLRLVAAKYK